MGNLKLKTAPTIEPITADELKTHLRIFGNAEDDYLSALITTAREALEKYLERAFITQTWTWTLDQAESRLEVPYAPLQSITSVKAYDWDGVATTQDATTYLVNADTDPGLILLKAGNAWDYYRGAANGYPFVDGDGGGAAGFVVEFVAGYGATAASVPRPLRHAILILAAKLYEHRGDVNEIIEERDVQSWIQPYERVGL